MRYLTLNEALELYRRTVHIVNLSRLPKSLRYALATASILRHLRLRAIGPVPKFALVNFRGRHLPLRFEGER